MPKRELDLGVLASVEPEAVLMLNADAVLVESPNLRGTRTKVVRDRGDLLVMTPGLPTVRIDLFSLAGSATALAEKHQQEGGN
jgi:hypothetical protein